ncbi:MAG: hypothetical protein K9L24_04645 [Spirochaetia bacterium]|nr:hypothetical protein [Spirochaetia bacterium]MCF7946947.1 hypothetical protein [Spirochaetia bacterium]
MIKKLLFFFMVFLLFLGGVVTGTNDLEFSLFTRTVSPVMKWGENGILTIPKATTIGRTNVYSGVLGQEAGVLNDMDLYMTSATVMVGTSEDVEIGYTRRQIIWEDLYFSDLAMDTFHLKTRVLDFGANLLPEVSIGLNGVSLVENTFKDKRNILFNPYIAATSTIELIPNFLTISATGVAETIMNEEKLGAILLNIGADVNLFNVLYGFGEIQGFNYEEPEQEVINVGAKIKLGWLSAGVGIFNIIREVDEVYTNVDFNELDFENANYMATVALDIPLSKLFAESR